MFHLLPLTRPDIERRIALVYLPGPMRNVASQALIAHLRQALVASAA